LVLAKTYLKLKRGVPDYFDLIVLNVDNFFIINFMSYYASDYNDGVSGAGTSFYDPDSRALPLPGRNHNNSAFASLNNYGSKDKQ